MKKILWLTSWYPNKSDAYAGDFIQRQAQAVSLFQPINVVYIGKSNSKTYSESEIQIENYSPNLKEYYLYYHTRSNIFSRLNSLYTYFKKGKKILNLLRENNEWPEIVHVHVAMKAGLLAVYLKWKYKIPYIVTEHWTGYYIQSKNSLFRKSIFERFLTRMILKNAASLLPVSEALGSQINKYWAKVPVLKIPNVVNTKLFFPANRSETRAFRFIHISTLLYPKNPEGIIKTFARLLNTGMNAELVLVGPTNPSVTTLLSSLPSSESANILVTGELPYEKVSEELRKTDVLIIFSYIENMPCVILEALCSGLPVIASQVGGISEVVLPENGILIEPGNEEQLLEAMKTMIVSRDFYNNLLISKKAISEFSYEAVGRKICSVYDSLSMRKL